MKKIYLTLIVILSLFQFVYAQWTTGTGTIYTTNNVGIGTTSPTDALDAQTNVNGVMNLRFTNTSTGTAAQARYLLSNGVNFGGLALNSSTYLTDPNALEIFATAVGGALIFATAGGERMRITQAGNMGIGTSSPTSPLTIMGGSTGVSINPHGSPFFGTLALNRDATTGAIYDATGNAFQINNGGTDYNLHFQVYNGSGTQITNNALVINGGDGSVGINTASTFGYRFAVNGTAIATAMTVKLYTSWPDYVFKKQYRIPSLAEVKTYIDQNKHLPDMPSALQVAKDGINLGDMDKLLVKKVEELTLYIIELNKQLKAQQKEIDELKNKH